MRPSEISACAVGGCETRFPSLSQASRRMTLGSDFLVAGSLKPLPDYQSYSILNYLHTRFLIQLHHKRLSKALNLCDELLLLFSGSNQSNQHRSTAKSLRLKESRTVYDISHPSLHDRLLRSSSLSTMKFVPLDVMR